MIDHATEMSPWQDMIRMVFHLMVFLPKFYNLRLPVRKSNWAILQNTWPILLKHKKLQESAAAQRSLKGLILTQLNGTFSMGSWIRKNEEHWETERLWKQALLTEACSSVVSWWGCCQRQERSANRSGQGAHGGSGFACNFSVNLKLLGNEMFIEVLK